MTSGERSPLRTGTVWQHRGDPTRLVRVITVGPAAVNVLVTYPIGDDRGETWLKIDSLESEWVLRFG